MKYSINIFQYSCSEINIRIYIHGFIIKTSLNFASKLNIQAHPSQHSPTTMQ
jgi:hypothetical protein